MRARIFALCLLVSGCEPHISADGFACAQPSECPSPFQCLAGRCRAPGSAISVAAAGDIACDPDTDTAFNGGEGTETRCRAKDTAALLRRLAPSAILPLGNLQQWDGTLDKFNRAYARHWGQEDLRALSYPVGGIREYQIPGASGLFGFFPELSSRGEGRAYYSYDLGDWHLIALNSNCSKSEVGGCHPDSAQGRWLAADLAANSKRCTLAYFNHPLFSSGTRASSDVLPLWEVLYGAGVELVLSSEMHYERFAPLRPDGSLDVERGLRSFLVGTGGIRAQVPLSPVSHSQASGAALGVLELQLVQDAYRWKFHTAVGVPFQDEGEGQCH